LRLFDTQVETGHFQELAADPIQHVLFVCVFGKYAHVVLGGSTIARQMPACKVTARGTNRPEFAEFGVSGGPGDRQDRRNVQPFATQSAPVAAITISSRLGGQRFVAQESRQATSTWARAKCAEEADCNRDPML
jgi:hypothetical protein